MIPNPFLYNSDAMIICIAICCVTLLAAIIILKAIFHKKNIKQKEQSLPNENELELQMIITSFDADTRALSYKERFIRHNGVKKRECVYISHDTHSMIMKFTNALEDRKITIGGYIDTVLKEHLKEYKDEINEIYNQSRGDLL